jgi:hypothetical protein
MESNVRLRIFAEVKNCQIGLQSLQCAWIELGQNILFIQPYQSGVKINRSYTRYTTVPNTTVLNSLLLDFVNRNTDRALWSVGRRLTVKWRSLTVKWRSLVCFHFRKEC